MTLMEGFSFSDVCLRPAIGICGMMARVFDPQEPRYFD